MRYGSKKISDFDIARSQVPVEGGQEGSLPDIILIHGFRGAPAGLQGIARELENAGHKVYSPAVPPFAGSPVSAEFTPKAYADFLKTYIEERNINKPILVGHSMGSIIAVAVAELYSNLIDNHLVLLSPVSVRPHGRFRILTPLSAYLPSKIVDYATTRYLFVPKNHALFKETFLVTRECSKTTTGRRSDIISAARFVSNNQLASFTPPAKDILFIAGERDRLIPKAATAELAKKWGAQAVFLPGCGHLQNYEKPIETANTILDFLHGNQ